MVLSSMVRVIASVPRDSGGRESPDFNVKGRFWGTSHRTRGTGEGDTKVQG